MRIRFWHSVFFRMLVIFFCATLPVYFVGISIYRDGAEQVAREVIQARIGQMEYYMRAFQNDIDRLIQMQSRIVSDTYINVIANRYDDLSSYEWGLRINTHIRELQSLEGISHYAYSVTTYYPSLGKKIHHLSGLSDMNEADRALSAAAGSARSRIFAHNGQYYCASSLRTAQKGAVYSIVTMLDKRRIREDLENFDPSLSWTAAILLREEHVVAETCEDSAKALVTAASAASGGADFGEEESTFAWMDSSSGIASGSIRAGYAGSRHVIAGVRSPVLDLTLYAAASEAELYAATRGFESRLWQFILAATFVIAVFSLLIQQMVNRPLRKLMAAFAELERGDMRVQIGHRRDDEFQILYAKFNTMVQNLSTYIDQAYTQRLLLQQAELNQLQAQINPHFLYNSYFLLHRMIKMGDSDNAQEFSRHMGDYFRFITRNAKKRVPLSEEVRHARNYADIQALRFEGRIGIAFEELPDPYGETVVPRLILQPVLENALEHGLKEKDADGLIHVCFLPHPHGLTIVVEDNGDDLDAEAIRALNRRMESARDGEVTALSNIHLRIAASFAAGSGLAFYRSSLGGLRVEIRIILEDCTP